jgi:hypothetical protein
MRPTVAPYGRAEVVVVDVAAAARAYQAHGWAVLPVHVARAGRCSCGRADCPSPGKHPRVRWERYEHARASVETVERWLERWPDTNLAVVTGAVSGVIVLDIDPRNGGDESLAALTERWGALPTTVETRTGGGGRHVWFRAPAIPVPSGPVAPGLDLKGEGGTVVVPPSVHVSGARYEWAADPDAQPLADAPEWLTTVAGGVVGAGPRHPLGRQSPRTGEEQAEFAHAWARAGVVLEPGDRYYLCPFHDDRHPSLHVDAEGCRWFCFGCQRGGGVAALRRELGDHAPGASRARRRGSIGTRTQSVTLAGDDEVPVVGEAVHQDALLELTGGTRRYGGVDMEAIARLVPDPENPVDEQSVAVFVEDRLIGWLAHDDARRRRAMIDEAARAAGAATCRARVRGGWDRGRDDIGWFGVVLLLPSVGASPGADDGAE